jgi:hypothetical protein
MFEGDFSARTRANLEIALDRVCQQSPIGDQHEFRKRIAQALIRCAKKGGTTLGALSEAGERELKRMKSVSERSA